MNLTKPILLLLFLGIGVCAQLPAIGPGVSQELAKWRAAHYSDVRYSLHLTLEKMSPVLKGTIEIRVKVLEPPASTGGMEPIILDWRKIRGFEERSRVSNVSVNGRAIAVKALPSAEAGGSDFNEHLIFREGVVIGENVIKLDFTSPILTSGSAITRYIDKEDGSEYLYSLFVPSDASTAFPVFDQPDLKARFTLIVSKPIDRRLELKHQIDWKFVSNTTGKDWVESYEIRGKRLSFQTTEFVETKPISTYIFAFAAGPFERVSEPPAVAGGLTRPIDKPSGGKPALLTVTGRSDSGQVGGSIFVRKSQAAKFKPHAAEVFRLMREDVKYLEGYFDYKFPWPKYDLVLIPEFPFGGMEHAGETFVRESGIIFPSEPTKNDEISRALLLFHETAHQWFGDTVTMKWFDDLWLKEGFANFMAYKALEKIMPEANAWKVFYERVKQAAYRTDSTRGTTPIYQPIANLSAAKSAYGNIVYNKAPAFLRQAEFYLGEDKFQTAVRAFLKKHEYGNATWEDLVGEFETASNRGLNDWAKQWVTRPGLPTIRSVRLFGEGGCLGYGLSQKEGGQTGGWTQRLLPLVRLADGKVWNNPFVLSDNATDHTICDAFRNPEPVLLFPDYKDYGYGIFLLDEKSRDYVLKNIQNEKDPFLRSMMWGALWDSVREGELDPRVFVELVVKVQSASFSSLRDKSLTQNVENESTTALLLNRVGTAMNDYMSVPQKSGGKPAFLTATGNGKPAFLSATGGDVLQDQLEDLLIERIRNAETLGQRITYYRAFLNVAASENARRVLKEMLSAPPASARGKDSAKNKRVFRSGAVPPAHTGGSEIPLKTKDRFDIVTRLAVLNDPDAPRLLAELEKAERSDDAKRYAYAAHAAFPTKENREKFWQDFVNNKQISESWIEAAIGPFNSIRNDELSLPYLERALNELPNLKRNRKIFFVNNWLGAFIGGQWSKDALEIVDKFLADNPGLDNDLRLKILENVDVIERAVKIRRKYKN